MQSKTLSRNLWAQADLESSTPAIFSGRGMLACPSGASLCNRVYPKPKQQKGVSFSTFKMISFSAVFPGLAVVQDDLSLLKLGSFYFRPDLALSHAVLLRQSCKFSTAAWQPVNRVRTLGEMSFWGYEGDEALGILSQGGNRCRSHNPITPKDF